MCNAVFLVLGLAGCPCIDSSVTVWTARVNGRLFTSALCAHLEKAMAEVLYLTGPEDASDTHQLSVMMVIVAF